MSTMTLRATNATFESVSTGEFASVEDAYRAAVLAGLEIAAGEVAAGTAVSIVQLAVDVGDRHDVMRGAVSVATARTLATSIPKGDTAG